MRNHRLLTIIGAGIASLLSSWLPAIAQPVLTYNGASTYKDSKDNIYMVNSGGAEITYRGVNAPELLLAMLVVMPRFLLIVVALVRRLRLPQGVPLLPSLPYHRFRIKQDINVSLGSLNGVLRRRLEDLSRPLLALRRLRLIFTSPHLKLGVSISNYL